MSNDYHTIFFTMLQQNLEPNLKEYIIRIKTTNDKRTLYIMVFYLRDILFGLGKRDQFYEFMKILAMDYPEQTCKMIPLIPVYGCWRDMWEIMCPELEHAILAYTKKVFLNDLVYCANEQVTKTSYLAKWLPREKSNPCLAKIIANYIYTGSQRSRLIRYRKEVSYINRAKHTVEINMCSNTWSKINPCAIPVECLKRNANAFLNITEDGNERYADEDRQQCRDHFLRYGRVIRLPSYPRQYSLHEILNHPRYEAVRSLFPA